MWETRGGEHGGDAPGNCYLYCSFKGGTKERGELWNGYPIQPRSFSGQFLGKNGGYLFLKLPHRFAAFSKCGADRGKELILLAYDLHDLTLGIKWHVDYSIKIKIIYL